MIRLSLDITHRDLTPAEEERLRQMLREAVQPFVTQVCCSMRRDAMPPHWEPDLVRKRDLTIEGSIQVVTP